MKIQEVAKACRITPSKIRFYEDKGLIDIPRNDNGYRLFDDEIILQIKLIVSLKDFGLSLTDIKQILTFYRQPASEDCNQQSKAYFQELTEEIESDLQRKKEVLSKLKTIGDLSRNSQEYQKNKQEIIQKITEVYYYD
ncbi:MerR family transcriptional regulator [Ignavigranum ruoffiae]|uniref:MerR family transcriptional regulator n=1 Tax=Ignavigranum ruoffiae TaxID=89093 RepID=UPI0020530F45|nr:MerR family transcriptional regulator [Ignavigranum ruoffiae]UPQ85118.1 MerR family transcriptional regulator [Ignavigranum ruoffiae]